MALLVPAVCVVLPMLEGGILRLRGGRRTVRNAGDPEFCEAVDMDELGLVDQKRSQGEEEASGQDTIQDGVSSEPNSPQYPRTPSRGSVKHSVINVCLSDTHSPELRQDSTPSRPEPSYGADHLLQESPWSQAHFSIPRPTTANSFGISESQFSMASTEDVKWCKASPVKVTKGAKLVTITSPRGRGAGDTKDGQNSECGLGGQSPQKS